MTEGVVSAACNRAGTAIFDSAFGGCKRASGARQSSRDEAGRPREADAPENSSVERCFEEALHIIRRVNAKKIARCGEWRFKELKATVAEQEVTDHAVFRDRKPVSFWQRQWMVVAVEQGQCFH